jgi:transposase
MRGVVNPQEQMFSYFSPEQRVPGQHPLRSIKAYADDALRSMRASLTQMYSTTGRPSIPPERLLKAQLLIALYTVRSDRLFCEALDYNILFRWFLDMSLQEASFDASVFSKNRQRLVTSDVALKFFDAIVAEARRLGLLSDEHFSVDGTLIEAWASMKSFQRKDGSGSGPDAGGDVDFKGERRTNDTHQSRTDPEAKLLRKGQGKEAKLCFAAHQLMDNRHGLISDSTLTQSVGTTEPEAAEELIDRQRGKGVSIKSVGGDKNYDSNAFVAALRERAIAPHIAKKDHKRTLGLDRRTTRGKHYKISQIVRKRIEQSFGWLKTIAGLRKTRLRGVARNRMLILIANSAYNLVRMSRLAPLV